MNDFIFNAAPVPALAIRAEEMLTDTDPTYIFFGSEDFEVDAATRQGKTFGQLIQQFAPVMGITFDPSKMTLRPEVVIEGEATTVAFTDPATSGAFILNSGSDSKGIS
jgi:hypothetical protein